MLRKIMIFVMVIVAVSALAQAPDTLWTRTFGNPYYTDMGNCVSATTDGGYIITGWTSDGIAPDLYLVKTDSIGNEEWSRAFGGESNDEGHSVQQTSDGGYIVVGQTVSFGAGQNDIWLIKTDHLGNEEWNQTFGGGDAEKGRSVQQTSDGGFIITGTTYTFGTGEGDVWLIKTDQSGNEEWSRTFGGSSVDDGECVQLTSDGGYIVVGMNYSFGFPNCDVWLIKTDDSGNEEWSQTYGGTGSDIGFSVQQTNDDGYIIAGQTWSFGAGESDVWLVKTDESGEEQWNRAFGGEEHDWGKSVVQTSDFGYIITGTTESFGAGWYDVYVFKTDSEGNLEWERTFGGSSQGEGKSVLQNGDTEYIIVGFEQSSPQNDIWMICLEGMPLEIELLPLYEPIFISPWGGDFGYYLQLSSWVDYEQIFDLWIDILLPDSTMFGPAILREDVTFQPMNHLSRLMIQEIPESATIGRYTYYGHVGDYSTQEIWHEDSFTFIKVDYDVGSSGEQISSWNLSGWEDPETLTGEPEEILPTEFALLGAYPNPFNPTTTIRFALPVASRVRLDVFDINGCRVGVGLAPTRQYPSGAHELTFDGSHLSSGIYIYRLQAADYQASGKMALIK